MPVQIDELVITTVVDPQLTGNAAGNTPPAGSIAMDDEIAEKVLQIIKEKTER